MLEEKSGGIYSAFEWRSMPVIEEGEIVV